MADKGKWGDRWNPKDDYNAQGEAIGGMRDGDAGPLIRLLRSGEIPNRTLSEELASMLEGTHPVFNLRFVGRSGRKGWSQQVAIDDHRKRVGVAAEAFARDAGPGGFDSAISKVQEIYPEHSRAYISKCRTEILDRLKSVSPIYRDECWDNWLDWWGPDAAK